MNIIWMPPIGCRTPEQYWSMVFIYWYLLPWAVHGPHWPWVTRGEL